MTPGTRLGPYEVLSLLGAGGMGEVYRAKDTKLKREVALKVLPVDVAQDRERLARFQREAEVLASLNHPQIGQIYGLEQTGDTFALVMELVEGEDLAQRIARGPLAIDEVITIARQIAEALEAAHDHSIIHRDLKPASIKVRPDGTMQSMKVFAALGLVVALTEPFGARSSVESARFRGPNGSGIADDNQPPIAFGPSEKRLWRTAVPRGHSSPVVWHDHIFITAFDDGALVTIALRRKDGTVLWRRVAPANTVEPVHDFSYPAAPTPATDGERVYAYFGSYGLLAYDFSGNEVWRHQLSLPPSRYGTATSPIVFDGKVILQRDGNSADSELLALNAKTGGVVWRTLRPLFGDSWSTPVIWSQNGREEIVTVGTNRIAAYTGDGVERWWVSGLGDQPIHVAVPGSDLLFASATSNNSPSDPMDIPKWDALIDTYDKDKDGRLALGELSKDAGIHLRAEVPKETPGNFLALTRVLKMADTSKDDILTKAEWDQIVGWARAREDKVLAIRPGGAGDSTKGHVAWTANRGLSEIPSPLFYRGRLYFVRSGGMVTSYAPDTGRVILDRLRLGALGQYVASPVAADGRIYVANELGTVVVFRAADTLDVLARNDLQESITATPAIADNKLYIRTAGHL